MSALPGGDCPASLFTISSPGRWTSLVTCLVISGTTALTQDTLARFRDGGLPRPTPALPQGDACAVGPLSAYRYVVVSTMIIVLAETASINCTPHRIGVWSARRFWPLRLRGIFATDCIGNSATNIVNRSRFRCAAAPQRPLLLSRLSHQPLTQGGDVDPREGVEEHLTLRGGRRRGIAEVTERRAGLREGLRACMEPRRQINPHRR